MTSITPGKQTQFIKRVSRCFYTSRVDLTCKPSRVSIPHRLFMRAMLGLGFSPLNYRTVDPTIYGPGSTGRIVSRLHTAAVEGKEYRSRKPLRSASSHPNDLGASTSVRSLETEVPSPRLVDIFSNMRRYHGSRWLCVLIRMVGECMASADSYGVSPVSSHESLIVSKRSRLQLRSFSNPGREKGRIIPKRLPLR